MNTVNKSIFSKLTFSEILANDTICLMWSFDRQFAQFSIYFFEMRKQIKYFQLLDSQKTGLKFFKLSKVVE